jgi:lactate permease
VIAAPLLAALPLALVLAGMVALRRTAAEAGVVGLVVAAALSVTVFDLGAAAPGGLGAAARGTALEALHSTFVILWIILPALALYEFQNRTGAILRIRDALGGLTADRRAQAILIAWFFGLFIEGAAGFGTPVALAAPLLVGLGYDPVRAVVLALLGHAAGVSFGAVGTPTLAQVELSGLDPAALAGRVATLHAILGPGLLLLMVRLAGEGPLTRSDLTLSALAAATFFVPSVAIAALVGPEVPSLGGALLGALAFVLVLRRGVPGRPAGLGTLLPDLAPYLAILALVLSTRLLPPLGEALRAAAFDWRLAGGFSGRFEPLYHPGTLLFLGLGAGAVLTGRTVFLGPALRAALVRLVPVAAALGVMLALSRVMVRSGMVETLAETAALTGPAWPVLAPAVGVLGTFITGSATASNILFTDFQLSAAGALGLSPLAMTAAQGAGSAVGNIVAPHNIIAGSATVGLVGREGDILRRTSLACLVYVLAAGLLTLATATQDG